MSAIGIYRQSSTKCATVAVFKSKNGGTISAMDCPNCKLVNPPTATRCDCGYDFQMHTQRESPRIGKLSIRETQTAWFFLFAIWALLLLPWFTLFGLTGMAWDSGDPLPIRDRVGIACIWAYPLTVVISLIFRRKAPALVLLPLLNIAVLGVLFKLAR
jgi:hypothetical protein